MLLKNIKLHVLQDPLFKHAPVPPLSLKPRKIPKLRVPQKKSFPLPPPLSAIRFFLPRAIDPIHARTLAPPLAARTQRRRAARTRNSQPLSSERPGSPSQLGAVERAE